MRRLIAALLVIGAAAEAQTIEVRKIRTLVDVDGRGFTRAPITITPISGGRYALAEVNELPIVIDREGRLVKRFVRGSGPGEFSGYTGGIATGPGDSLYAANGSRILVFNGNMKYVRTITPVSTNPLLEVRDGFITSVTWSSNPGIAVSGVGLMDREGKRVRFFISDTAAGFQGWPPPAQYVLGPVDRSSFWTGSSWTHRLERWSVAGGRTSLIEQRPSWFVVPPVRAASPRVTALLESDGVLWVMSAVPVPNVLEIMREANERRRGETDVRAVPTEQLSTAWLEAYDAATGRQLAELPLKKFGVAILDGSHFMVYTSSANDTAQLEIWEMKLKR